MATHQKKHIKRKFVTSKELLLCNSNEGEIYGQITGPKGDARFEVKIIENSSLVIAKARGILIKGPQRKRLLKDDYVLIQKDIITNSDKYFIIHKYSPEDVKKLKQLGELITINDYTGIDNDNNSNTNILFDEEILIKMDELDINDDFIAGI